MLYAVLCYECEDVISAWSAEHEAKVMGQLGEVLHTLNAQGRMGPVARLMPTTAATTVRKGREALVIDGPFAETKEQLLGFYVVDCADLDAALKVAKDLAKASGSAGAFELRPLMYFNAWTSSE